MKFIKKYFQPQQQQHAGGAPHRNDSGPHLMDMNKYGTTAGLGTGREQHQQSGSSGVAPPPGFGNSYMQVYSTKWRK